MHELEIYEEKRSGMLQVAVFSDIHGNYHALKECLEIALNRKVDGFIFLGDYLGEFAYPRRTLEHSCNSEITSIE